MDNKLGNFEKSILTFLFFASIFSLNAQENLIYDSIQIGTGKTRCSKYTYYNDPIKRRGQEPIKYEAIPIYIHSKIYFDSIYEIQYTDYSQKLIIENIDSTKFKGEYIYCLCVKKPWEKSSTILKTYSPSNYDLILQKKGYNDLIIKFDANKHFSDFAENYPYIIVRGENEGKGYVFIRNEYFDQYGDFILRLKSNDQLIYPHVDTIQNIKEYKWVPEGNYDWNIIELTTSIPNQKISGSISIKEGKNDIDLSNITGTFRINNKIINTDNYKVVIKDKNNNVGEHNLSSNNNSEFKLLNNDSYLFYIKEEGTKYELEPIIVNMSNGQTPTFYFGRKIIPTIIDYDRILIKSNFLKKEDFNKDKFYPPGEYELLFQKNNYMSHKKMVLIPFNDKKDDIISGDFRWQKNPNITWSRISWSTFGAFALAATFSLIKSEIDYKNYKTSENTSDATRLHKNAKNWQNAFYICAGASVVTFTFGIVFSVKSKKPLVDEKIKNF